MDPTATYYRMKDALAFGDADEAVQAAHDLSSWLTRGGAYPDGFAKSHSSDLWTIIIFVQSLAVHPPTRNDAAWEGIHTA